MSLLILQTIQKFGEAIVDALKSGNKPSNIRIRLIHVFKYIDIYIYKYMYSIFKQYYTCFHTFFSLMFLKKLKNCYLNTSSRSNSVLPLFYDILCPTLFQFRGN